MAVACASPERRPPRTAAYWLWMLVIAMTSVIIAFLFTNALLPPERALSLDAFGQDFLAFYSAGRMVDAGRAGELYDLAAHATLQKSIAVEAGFRLAAEVAPWWNPPYVAWLFVPLSRMPFYAALAAWSAMGLVMLAGSAALLAGLLRSASQLRRDWLLVPALLAIAPLTLQALGHGQSTPLSLLLLTLTVLAWRSRRPLLTGFACAALCYKPQLAAIVGLAAFATLGWRVAVGGLLGLVPVLLFTVTAMPGVLTDFLTRVPANLHVIQFENVYLWHRHVTFEGFLRFAFQGNSPADTIPWIRVVAMCCLAVTLASLGVAWRRLRLLALREPGDEELTLDRFITLVILSTPLAMPYFLDYDLLLLAIPSVLTAREMMLADDHSRPARWLKALFPILFIWLACNPPLAEAYGINLTVPLLVAMTAVQARRCIRGVDTAAPMLALAEYEYEANLERRAA